MASRCSALAICVLVGGVNSLNIQARNSVGNRAVSSAPGLQLSNLGCGTWSWGNRLLFDYSVDQDESLYETYSILRDSGITTFDTADSYGTLDLNGRAETLLGQFEGRYLSENGGNMEEIEKPWWQPNSSPSMRGSVQVATKFAPYPWRLSARSLVEAARQSLDRLDGTPLTLCQAHWSTKNYLPAQESVIWRGLADCYDEGLCAAVGVSNYGPRQLQAAAQYFRERQVPLATAQTQFSLLTYADTATQQYTQVCEDLQITCLSYSPLCLGLLTGKYNLDNLPNKGPRRQLFSELLPSAQPVIDLLRAMASDRKDCSPSQIAIRWCVQQDTIPLVGCRTPDQARELVGVSKIALSQSEIEVLSQASREVSKPMIQNIFQTK